MAQHFEVLLVDDIDGGPATKSMSFTWQGKNYEIDVSDANADAFASAIGPYLEASRRVSATRPESRRAPSPYGPGWDASAVRVWAEKQGYKLSPRGRIPKQVAEAYLAASKH